MCWVFFVLEPVPHLVVPVLKTLIFERKTSRSARHIEIWLA